MRPRYAPTKSERQRCGAADGAIVATLSGSDTATALGLTMHSSTPVIVLCRALIAAGHDPATRMHVFRGDVFALIVRSIGEGARLRVGSHGVGFEADPACGASLPIVPTAPARTGTPPGKAIWRGPQQSHIAAPITTAPASARRARRKVAS